MLKALDALDGDEAITPLGRVLADLPIDAVLGKMLIMSSVGNQALWHLLYISYLSKIDLLDLPPC
jgi:HrpA-like RNA helicase